MAEGGQQVGAEQRPVAGMGNAIAVDEKPLPFNDIGKAVQAAPPSRFPANLKGWKLSSDANRRW